MYYQFIVNPKGGINRAKKAMTAIGEYLYSRGILFELSFTTRPGGAKALAQRFTKNDGEPKKIVVVGGDGTFCEFLNGIECFENLEVGLIPAGRGNDFAAAAGISDDPITAMKAILEGNTRKVDFIECGDMRCLNVAGTGMDVDCLLKVAKMKRSNKLSYLKALLKTLRRFEPYPIVLELDGQVLERNCITAVAANGTCFGGGMKISPNSKIDDGLIHVVVVSLPKNGRVFPVLPSFLSGKHINMEFCEEYVCKNVRIYPKNNFPVQIDGEVFEDMKLDCNIVSDKLVLLN